MTRQPILGISQLERPRHLLRISIVRVVKKITDKKHPPVNADGLPIAFIFLGINFQGVPKHAIPHSCVPELNCAEIEFVEFQ